MYLERPLHPLTHPADSEISPRKTKVIAKYSIFHLARAFRNQSQETRLQAQLQQTFRSCLNILFPFLSLQLRASCSFLLPAPPGSALLPKTSKRTYSSSSSSPVFLLPLSARSTVSTLQPFACIPGKRTRAKKGPKASKLHSGTKSTVTVFCVREIARGHHRLPFPHQLLNLSHHHGGPSFSPSQ